MSEFERTQLDIQQRQLDIMQAATSQTQDSSAIHKQGEKSKILALAKKKHDAFLEEAAALSDITSKYPAAKIPDPEKYMDQDISCMMREVSGWKNSLKDLTKSFNMFQELTVVHRLAENQMDAVEIEMETVRNAITDLVVAVEKEDKDRNIRALDHSKSEQRKFNTFSGVPGTDFLLFKKDFEEAALANRISRSNQLEELRENLTGAALKQVPRNMTGGLHLAWQA